MSSQHRLREKQQVYDLLTKLLSAMKALAYAELQKLQSQRLGQKNVLVAYRRAISVLLRHGAVLQKGVKVHASTGVNTILPPLFIVVGTERGFCGDINRSVYAQVKELMQEQQDAGLIVIGERIFKFYSALDCVSRLNGAVVAEDVEPLVTELVSVIIDNLYHYSFIDTRVIFLDDLSNHTVSFPLIETGEQGNGLNEELDSAYGPLLYEAPATILEKLLPEYFFATLQFCIKSALISENRARYTHMQEATNHLDDKRQQLTIKMNQARRENIIEEIMVSLYNEDANPDKVVTQ